MAYNAVVFLYYLTFLFEQKGFTRSFCKFTSNGIHILNLQDTALTTYSQFFLK